MQNTVSTSLPTNEPPLIAPVFDQNENPITSQPVIARSGDAYSVNLPGEKAAIVLSEKQTNNQLCVGTCEVAPNAGPPTHIHNNEEEIFIIESGAIKFFVNGEYLEARAGDIVYAARGEAHRFEGVDSGAPNRFTIIVCPGDFERFYGRFEQLLASPSFTPEDAAALGQEFGIEMFPSDAEAPVVDNPKSQIFRAGSIAPIPVLGENVQIILSAANTQGRYTLVNVEGPKDSGPPLHFHEYEDELFIIQEGVFEFSFGDDKHLAYPGDVVWGPRGFAHTFRVASEEGARMMTLMTPGGFDRFFTDCADLTLANQVTPENLIALGAHCGLTFVPPASA